MVPKVELLAPAGTWETFETVIEAGADAVYLGGKRFNMRMHRKDFNFDDEQLRDAVEYAHAHNVKLYVTVNNLLSDEEVEEVEEYLNYLDQIGVDAIIIQDLVMLDLLQKQEYHFEIHVSVMMNASNLDTLLYLKDRGVTRVVTSREISLEQIQSYRQQIDLEFEYFVHGDMCYSQSGQCLYGGILFGLSSNRGKCVKPCRWPFRLMDENYQHHLAVKDMCMIHHLRELIQSGVECFKIEGRMRTPEYLRTIVSAYRQEINRYLADSTGYYLDPTIGNNIWENRTRDFSSCFAFGNPGQEMLDITGAREPRQFSSAIKEPEITPEVTQELKVQLTEGLSGEEKADQVILSVKVPTFEHFLTALDAGAERIIIGGDTYKPYLPWSAAEIAQAIQLGALRGRKVIYQTPSIVMEKEMNDLKMLFDSFSKYYLHVMTGNIGVVEALYSADLEFSLYGDLGLNVYNSRTLTYLKRQGFESAIISLEAGVKEIKSIARKQAIDVEIMAYAPLRGMVSDNCLKAKRNGMCKSSCTGGYSLEDQAGCIHRVEVDQYCRNHIFLQNYLSTLPLLGELVQNGIRIFRLDGAFCTPKELKELIEIYRKVIRFDFDNEVIEETFALVKKISQVPLTFGALVANR